jgi:flagella basal body P-ring formation protein FlgA
MRLDELSPPIGTTRRARPRAARHSTAVCALLALAAPMVSAAPDGEAWQPVETIRRAAEQHALELVGDRDGVTVEAVAIDERLRLPLCSEPLRAVSDAPLANGRGTMTVSCRGDRAWRLFVPVRTSHDVAVVVAVTTLQRGNVLSQADLRLERRRSTALPYQYLSRVEDAVGYTVRRTLPGGSLVAPTALEKADIVKRGALVTLVTARGGVMVSTEGVAVENAGLGDRVRVRTPVGRVVEGIVESASRVRVGG